MCLGATPLTLTPPHPGLDWIPRLIPASGMLSHPCPRPQPRPSGERLPHPRDCRGSNRLGSGAQLHVGLFRLRDGIQRCILTARRPDESFVLVS